MKTHLKIIAVMSALCLAIAAQAQVVLGSFQGAGDPLNAGWIDVNAGSPITSSTNCSFVAAGVPGFSQSLDISAAGHAGSFGYPSLKLGFSPAQIAAFNTNSWVTFTFSAPVGTYTGGYAQIYNLAFNATTYGYNNHSWSTMLSVGNTNNNSAGSGPNFYFSSGANPLMTQTVTVNYSDITNAIIAGGESFLEMTLQGNQGGGAPVDFLLNSVVLSTTPFGTAPGAPTIIVDQFNPTNNPYAGTNIYAEGDITNVYGPWFGTPSTITWDPTMDAQSNANSGAIEISTVFTGNNQWIFTDGAIGSGTGPGINPPITNNLSLLTFEFDVKYAPTSPTVINAGVTNFGHLEWGIVGGPVGGYSGSGYGFVEVPATNTGWVHVVIPLNPAADADFESISDIFFKQDGSYYGGMTGTSTLWLDNLKFTYTNVAPVLPPPTVAIQKVVPALRIYAGDSSSIYSREEVTSTGQGQSWIGQPGPVKYSYTLLSYSTNIGQTHIFLLPVNSITSGQTPWSYNGVDYSFASNAVWLDLQPGPTNGSAIVSVQWKTNLPSANPNQMALQYTNAGFLGTWTLQFDNGTSGAGRVIAPDGSNHAFAIQDPDIVADFGGPLVSYFGLQPNSTAGEGQYEDWASISVTGVADGNITEDFTKEGSDFSGTPLISPSGYFRSDISAVPAGVTIIRTNLDKYWVSWTLPAIGLSIGSNTNLPASQWINPAYYDDYNEVTPRGIPSQFGPSMWVLLPLDNLPTVDGNIGSQVAPTAFFNLSTNVVNPPGF